MTRVRAFCRRAACSHPTAKRRGAQQRGAVAPLSSGSSMTKDYAVRERGGWRMAGGGLRGTGRNKVPGWLWYLCRAPLGFMYDCVGLFPGTLRGCRGRGAAIMTAAPVHARGSPTRRHGASGSCPAGAQFSAPAADRRHGGFVAACVCYAGASRGLLAFMPGPICCSTHVVGKSEGLVASERRVADGARCS